MGDIIEDIPKTDNINPPFGDDNLCIVSLPSVIPVSYKHGLTSGALISCQLEQMEDYHPIMGQWGNTMQCKFSSWSGMSTLTLRTITSPTIVVLSCRQAVQLHKDDNGNEPCIQS
eukprot:10470613-Ditylum_brightwellii.AAC.1